MGSDCLYNIKTGAVLVGMVNETGSLDAVIETLAGIDPQLAAALDG